jgi:phage antirepressor YoqD-like protein
MDNQFDISIFEIDKTKNMVNLTKLAKCFNKDVNQWKRLPNTVDFLRAWKQVNELCENHIVSLEGGAGSGAGTWAHREIALKFAQWISSDFEVFCIKKLDELFQTGTTTIAMQDDVSLMVQGLQAAHRLVEKQTAEIAVLKPKADYADKVLASTSTWTITTIAKELDMSAIKLNVALFSLQVQFKNSDEVWVLYSKYQDKGYTETRTYAYHDEHGEAKTSISTVWTEKGRKFIHSLFNK